MSLAANLPGASWCSVVGGTGAFAVNANRGFTSSNRTGAGVYSLVVNAAFRGFDPILTAIDLQIIGGAGNANGQVTTADGITFAVTTFVAAVATDESFQLTLNPIQS